MRKFGDDALVEPDVAAPAVTLASPADGATAAGDGTTKLRGAGGAAARFMGGVAIKATPTAAPPSFAAASRPSADVGE
jgi:hypothetical protein